MSTAESDMRIQGAEVFDDAGERIGIAADPGGPYFMIEEGALVVKRFYLPKRVIARVGKDGVYLRLPKVDAEAIGRAAPPGDDDPWEIEPGSDEPAASR